MFLEFKRGKHGYILKAEFLLVGKFSVQNSTVRQNQWVLITHSTQHFETFGKTESESTQIGIHDTFFGNSFTC